MHPTFTYSLRWFWKRLRFQVGPTYSGDATACPLCGKAFIVTTKGETIDAGPPAAKPRVVGLTKPKEPEAVVRMKDDDLAESPQW